MDVLRQTRERVSFVGSVDSPVVFTRQAPINIRRKAMVFREGDTYFNRRRVTATPPYQQLPRCTASINRWRDEAKLVAFVEDDEAPRKEAETTVKDEEVVPYPHELSTQLTQD